MPFFFFSLGSSLALVAGAGSAVAGFSSVAPSVLGLAAPGVISFAPSGGAPGTGCSTTLLPAAPPVVVVGSGGGGGLGTATCSGSPVFAAMLTSGRFFRIPATFWNLLC